MMKKNLALLMLVLCFEILFAQAPSTEKSSPGYYQQGEWFVGISPWFSLRRVITLANTGLTIGGPSYYVQVVGGQFVSDKILFGSSFSYGANPFANLQNTRLKASLLGRYYLRDKIFSPFVEGTAGFYRDTYFDTNLMPVAVLDMYVGGKLGLAYRLGNISLESTWGLDWLPFEDELRRTLTQPGLHLGINFHI
jgi:hypothetical protein